MHPLLYTRGASHFFYIFRSLHLSPYQQVPSQENIDAIWDPLSPTFVIVQLIPVAVDDICLQKTQESTCDEEAVGKRKVFDVTHVQGKRV